MISPEVSISRLSRYFFNTVCRHCMVVLGRYFMCLVQSEDRYTGTVGTNFVYEAQSIIKICPFFLTVLRQTVTIKETATKLLYMPILSTYLLDPVPAVSSTGGGYSYYKQICRTPSIPEIMLSCLLACPYLSPFKQWVALPPPPSLACPPPPPTLSTHAPPPPLPNRTDPYQQFSDFHRSPTAYNVQYVQIFMWIVYTTYSASTIYTRRRLVTTGTS
jgi:hypothetical protein